MLVESLAGVFGISTGGVQGANGFLKYKTDLKMV